MAVVFTLLWLCHCLIYLNILFINSYLYGGLINTCMEALQLVRESLILKKDRQEWTRVECPKPGPFIVSENNRDLITYFHS